MIMAWMVVGDWSEPSSEVHCEGKSYDGSTEAKYPVFRFGTDMEFGQSKKLLMALTLSGKATDNKYIKGVNCALHQRYPIPCGHNVLVRERKLTPYLNA